MIAPIAEAYCEGDRWLPLGTYRREPVGYLYEDGSVSHDGKWEPAPHWDYRSPDELREMVAKNAGVSRQPPFDINKLRDLLKDICPQ